MKKIILVSLVLISLLFNACGGNNSGTVSGSVSSDKTQLSTESTKCESSSEEVSISASSEASSSEESSEESGTSSEESTDEPYAPTTEEICNEIAAINTEGFKTNIVNDVAADAIAELETYLNGKGYGIFYCDLEYNGYIASGCNKDFKTASTSKLPYIKYLATLVDKGEVDLNDKILYDSSLHDPGSGILKGYPSGGYYTVDTLMDYVLRYSDNIAYKMLFGKYGLNGFVSELARLGVEFETYNGYGNCTAAEMGAMLYDAAMYNGSCLEAMKDAGCNASYNYQIGAELKEYDVFQKYGAIKPGNVAYHDIAIVYAPHPYILVIYTTIDYDSAGKNGPFRTIARMVDNINSALYSD